MSQQTVSINRKLTPVKTYDENFKLQKVPYARFHQKS